MTFASDTVRQLFHELPTATQVMYSDMEQRLAKQQRRIHIDAVMRNNTILEVIIRIFEDFRLTSPITNNS